jgi:hypothetical protein
MGEVSDVTMKEDEEEVTAVEEGLYALNVFMLLTSIPEETKKKILLNFFRKQKIND